MLRVDKSARFDPIPLNQNGGRANKQIAIAADQGCRSTGRFCNLCIFLEMLGLAMNRNHKIWLRDII